VVAWVELHKEDLLGDWGFASKGEDLVKIELLM
jgi:hypothetical protein